MQGDAGLGYAPVSIGIEEAPSSSFLQVDADKYNYSVKSKDKHWSWNMVDRQEGITHMELEKVVFLANLNKNGLIEQMAPFWTAAPKGTKSCRTQGDLVFTSIRLSIHPFVRLPPLIVPLRPQNQPF